MQPNLYAAPAAEHTNQLGCPYLNQAGWQAVCDWAHVLERIDTRALSPELQNELRQLRLASDRAERNT